MPTYAYARVSTDGQSLAAQHEQLREAGAHRVYAETISGAITDRPELERLLHVLGPGDVLLVTRLDRLARSTRDLLNVLARVAAQGAAFRSLGDTWADTTTPHGRLMLVILGGLAEFERELIRTRTTEGRIRAKAAGVRFGTGSPKMTPDKIAQAHQMRNNDASMAEIGKALGVHHSTISRVLGRKSSECGETQQSCAKVNNPTS